jgi:hypothetical protein
MVITRRSNPGRVMRRAGLRSVDRVWRDLRVRDLYRSGKQFELMQRALGFAALATLTFIPLLILVTASAEEPVRSMP